MLIREVHRTKLISMNSLIDRSKNIYAHGATPSVTDPAGPMTISQGLNSSKRMALTAAARVGSHELLMRLHIVASTIADRFTTAFGAQTDQRHHRRFHLQ